MRIPMISYFLAGLAMATASAVKAVPRHITRRDTVPEGYTIGEIGWIGNFSLEGGEQTLTGTVESVVAQILEINPNYTFLAAAEVDLQAAPVHQSASLDRRSFLNHFCGAGSVGYYGGGWAHAPSMENEIGYLNGLGDNWCTAPARSCSRVSCSWDTAIWMCNDNHSEWRARCGWLGTMSNEVMHLCRKSWTEVCQEFATAPGKQHCAYKWYDEVWGQLFDSEGFNVILTKDSC